MGLWHDLRAIDRLRAAVDAAGASPTSSGESDSLVRPAHTSHNDNLVRPSRHVRTTDSGYEYVALGEPQGSGEVESGALVDYAGDFEAAIELLREYDDEDYDVDEPPYAYQFAEWARCTECGEAGRDGVMHLGCGGTFLRDGLPQ